MAKMFYTLEEAAERLGVGTDELTQMAEQGQLQQFRDRDKVMFKREQVDSMASDASSETIAESDEEPQPQVDQSDETDQIDLKAATASDPQASGEADRSSTATGISVFDADEVDEEADPSAQTVVTESGTDDEELSLDSVGSGSGLLDLTRESDDTSLGAELLDEIYPGEESSDEKMDAPGSATGVLEGADSGASGIAEMESEGGYGPPVGAAVYPAEAISPAADGFSAGMLIGASAALTIAFIVAFAATSGLLVQLAVIISENLWPFVGGLLAVSIVLGVIGLVIGKAVAR